MVIIHFTNRKTEIREVTGNTMCYWGKLRFITKAMYLNMSQTQRLAGKRKTQRRGGRTDRVELRIESQALPVLPDMD